MSTSTVLIPNSTSVIITLALVLGTAGCLSGGGDGTDTAQIAAGNQDVQSSQAETDSTVIPDDDASPAEPGENNSPTVTNSDPDVPQSSETETPVPPGIDTDPTMPPNDDSDPAVPPNVNVTPDPDPQVEYTNCDQNLPCQWATPDGGLTITISAAITDAISGRLSLIYTLQTTRDTKIELLPTSSVVDSTGKIYSPRDPVLVNADGGRSQTESVDLLAGITLTVEQAFTEAPALDTRSVARVSLALIEANQAHVAGFLQLPINTNSEQTINCLHELPCTWQAQNGEYSVSVLLADGLSHGRLVTHFRVDAHADILLNLDTGSIAIGNDGTAFKPKLHTLGDHSDYLAFDAAIIADASLSGAQSYFRTSDHNATALKKMTVNITPASAPGTAIPVFSNVPLN